MSTANRIVKNTGILYAKMGITVFISLYTTRLILASLGVNDFGVFNLVGGAIAMLTFLNTAMAAATQRFMSFAEGAGDSKQQISIFNVSVILHFLIAIIILIILEIGGHFLFNGIFKIPPERVYSAKLVYQFMVISTIFTVMSVPYDAVINAHENMLLFAILGVLESIMKLGIAIYLLHTTNDKLISYGLLTALLSILLLLIRRVYCKNKYKECKVNLKIYFNKSIFKDLTSFAAWSFLGASTSMVSNYGQGILINMFFGPIVNTAQGISSQVSGQLGVFAGTMQKALNPVIDKSEGAGNRKLMLTASLMGSKVSFFLLLLFYVPVLIEMPFIFKLWLKNVPEFAVIFCRLLLIRNLIEQLFITLVSSISATGNIRNYQIYSSSLGFLPLIISFLLFKLNYPPYMMYVVFIFYAMMASCLILWYANKNFDLSISYFLKDVVLRCLISFSILSLFPISIIFFIPKGLFQLFLVSFINVLSFPIVAWLIGFNKQERLELRKVLSNVFKIKNRLQILNKS
jgi:O-antigen/teichoic acid export membrane protein